MTELTFFGRKLIPAGNWTTHCMCQRKKSQSALADSLLKQKTTLNTHFPHDKDGIIHENIYL